MSEQAELAFAKTYLNTLSSQPITFANDYRQPLENSLKRVAVFPIPLPEPPKRHEAGNSISGSASAEIALTFKSLKPPASYTLTVSPTDTIASIKSQLSKTHATAPPADAQRLLVKGKALADSKLLKEYNVQSGDTVNLMVKPGVNWDPSKPKEQEILQPKPLPASETGALGLAVGDGPASGKRKHGRAPSIVLSPSPSSDMPGAAPEKDILLSLDTTTDVPTSATETLSTYHTTITNPDFWEKLLIFLQHEFATETDGLQAWEEFLRASKGSLTANQIAKIRDHVGVMGMAGI
ncbi:hypothetical protein Agabi119p4_8160 [Agaricus bisporus var. burnettii]|uniref:Ubiquitin-like domain-containing protein n=1 Tax=Agaricus bisporus var. burnettii TaxID=192524 RepID=A0A8H7C5B3_AGABI|nr:hypothetical protein Agabi119p4_8160 [Agaricus bisporus var. burnettii]